ncbi:MAG: hypothetical protein NWQ09_01990 [Nonlabens sp.]|nr:hypothetical protein [Nonlabens sp.]MDP5100072.1 hypothetical protein [Nonlabens sp.]
MEHEKKLPQRTNSKKWTTAYIMVIAANLVFAVIFYIISSIYGGN